MITNHTVTAAPEEAAVVELDPELDAALAAHVADVLRGLRVLDHHLRGVAPKGSESRLYRARDAAHDGVSQMLAADEQHPTAQTDAVEVTR